MAAAPFRRASGVPPLPPQHPRSDPPKVRDFWPQTSTVPWAPTYPSGLRITWRRSHHELQTPLPPPPPLTAALEAAQRRLTTPEPQSQQLQVINHSGSINADSWGWRGTASGDQEIPLSAPGCGTAQAVPRGIRPPLPLPGPGSVRGLRLLLFNSWSEFM